MCDSTFSNRFLYGLCCSKLKSFLASIIAIRFTSIMKEDRVIPEYFKLIDGLG